MVWHMLREMRAEAVRTRGYRYGETWQLASDARVVMVLSVWASLEHWQEWKQSEYRQKIGLHINRMLRKPNTVRVFTDAEEPPATTPLLE